MYALGVKLTAPESVLPTFIAMGALGGWDSEILMYPGKPPSFKLKVPGEAIRLIASSSITLTVRVSFETFGMESVTVPESFRLSLS